MALQNLDIPGTVTDPSPLAGCTALRHLNIRFTIATDTSPLAACVALEEVSVVGSVFQAGLPRACALQKR
jgi:hypothetical protein